MKSKLGALAVLFSCLITLSPAAFPQNNPQYAAAQAGWQWPANANGVTQIPVCWENSQGFPAETQWVRSAIESTWQSAANVEFQGWGPCANYSRGIRILITDTRSNSRVGRALDGLNNGMELNFTFRNFSRDCQAKSKKEGCIKSVAVHEFGHALGFLHEQDRADSTCSLEKNSDAGWPLTEYDPDSVMNYCNPRWNNGGQLSYNDIKGVQRLYGPKTGNSPGQILVSDNLAPGQTWENVVLEIGGSQQFFAVNPWAPTQWRAWNFSRPGNFSYKVATYTQFQNGGVWGYGEGSLNVEGGKTHSYELVGEWNTFANRFDLKLIPR
jgi:hypothetical protein